jgi:hypothetical protein
VPITEARFAKPTAGRQLDGNLPISNTFLIAKASLAEADANQASKNAEETIN